MRRARPKGGIVVAVDVGKQSSNHDRACEAFAQLIGCQTDYGHVHALRCGHRRYGEDFTGRGLLDAWSAQRPIHIVGHSFGGNTSLALVTLLAQDFWGYGTSASWVLSISTICSPLRGTALPFAWGFDPDKPCRLSDEPPPPPPSLSPDENSRADVINRTELLEGKLDIRVGEAAHEHHHSSSRCGACDECDEMSTRDGEKKASSKQPQATEDQVLSWSRSGQIPGFFCVAHLMSVPCSLLKQAQLAFPFLNGLWDFKMVHWDDHPDFLPMLTMRHPYWINGDNMLNDATPKASSAELRRVRPHLSNIYLVSVTPDTHVAPISMPTERQLRRAKVATAVTAVALSTLAIYFRNQIRTLLRLMARGAKRRYMLALAAAAAILRHRAVQRLRSPKLAAAVALGSVVAAASAAATAAAVATVFGIPLQLPRDQQLAVLRPILERMRPAVHAYLFPWLVRPAMRLNAAAIRRAAAVLQGDLRVKFSSFPSDNTDGVVDLPSQRGVDAVEPVQPKIGGGLFDECEGGMRKSASTGDTDPSGHAALFASELMGAGAPPQTPPTRNFSCGAFLGSDLSGGGEGSTLTSIVGGGGPSSSAAVSGSVAQHQPLERGRWHIMRVPGAEHSLGTWASDKSDEMYRQLFAMLDALDTKHHAGGKNGSPRLSPRVARSCWDRPPFH